MDYDTVVEAIAECALIATKKKAIIPRSIANKHNRVTTNESDEVFIPTSLWLTKAPED